MAYSPWGHKSWDVTDKLSITQIHTHTHTCIIFTNSFLSTLCSLQDPSSPTKDWNLSHGSESTASPTAGPPGNSMTLAFIKM